MRALLGLIATALVLASATPALAQVYRYKKPDGTVVFTDNLAELPPARRAYYNRRAQEAKERLEKIRAAQTPAERREAEREADAARAKQEAEAEVVRRKRLAAIQRLVTRIRADEEKRAQTAAYWAEREAEAKKALDEAVDAYEAAKTEWEGLAMKAGFALFPGQAERKKELQDKLPELAAEVEAANTYLYETLPEERALHESRRRTRR